MHPSGPHFVPRTLGRAPLRQALAGLIAVALVGWLGSPAVAEDDTVPTEAEVIAAQAAAEASAMNVAEVQDRLAEANNQLWAATTAAEQATEAFNGARWRWQEAKRETRIAESEQRAAQAEADHQQQVYSEALVASYQMAPELTALSAIVRSDGIETVIERSSTMVVAEDAMSARYDDLQAANQAAEIAADKAVTARTKAAKAATEARTARDQARGMVSQAAAISNAIAGERDVLIARFAELRGISVALAEERQAALEAVPPESTAPEEAPAPEAAPEEDADQPAEVSPSTAPAPSTPTKAPTKAPTKSPTKSPTTPPSSPAPTTPPVQPPPTAPSPSAGAAAAVAFARAQIGDRYQYGAAGPNAWDCSGLTQGAWAAGGKSLPHYSVAQYTQSTPIRSSQLQPGDLLFWGSSGSPNSIYHVALYVGGGKMIHAPRRGKPVAEVSVNYWIAPNFFARP